MKLKKTKLKDVLLIHPESHMENGYEVFETFNLKEFSRALNLNINFVQDNHSLSKKGVLRGLHYQTNNTQGKLVRVIRGEIFDVVVDLRISSATYGQWEGHILSSQNRVELWIPPGFAHGFVVLSSEAEFLYKTTDYWDPESEQCILWSDAYLKIIWPKLEVEPIVSSKDLRGLDWANAPKL